jgi:hypothetical protein
MAETPRGEEAFARNRAVVSDDGHRIRLSVYVAGVEAPLGVAELPLEVAARLAADLAGAVAAHLARERNHRVGVVRGPAQ